MYCINGIQEKLSAIYDILVEKNALVWKYLDKLEFELFKLSHPLGF